VNPDGLTQQVDWDRTDKYISNSNKKWWDDHIRPPRPQHVFAIEKLTVWG